MLKEGKEVCEAAFDCCDCCRGKQSPTLRHKLNTKNEGGGMYIFIIGANIVRAHERFPCGGRRSGH